VKKPDRKVVIATIGLIVGAACAVAGPAVPKKGIDLIHHGERMTFPVPDKSFSGES
jgi:hypothetical protein